LDLFVQFHDGLVGRKININNGAEHSLRLVESSGRRDDTNLLTGAYAPMSVGMSTALCMSAPPLSFEASSMNRL
jgi:hypothetical protein